MVQFDDPERVLHELMRRDFRAFLRKAFAHIRGGEAIGWNWHLDAIAHELECIRRGDNQRLLVTMPPRYLKSITISVAWVAWMLGRNPRLNIVCVSYSSDLAAKHARDCLAIMRSSWYRALFPGTILTSQRAAALDFATTRGGGRLATSITGTLTGRGGDILIIDDPIKPDEAYSDTVREAVNTWYRSTLASRLNDKKTGAIITVMQRVHQHDLVGMLRETPGWRELRLAAIANADEVITLPRGKQHRRKAGDVLHPARDDRAALERQQQMMGPILFEAQYQQNPVPAEGNMIQREWLQHYAPGDLVTQPGTIFQSWDTASKDGVNNDWSVCVTASVYRAHVRIIDVFRRKLKFPELKEHTVRLARLHGAQTLLIEDAASGQQLIQSLRAEQPRGLPLPVACRPELDKKSRVFGATGMIAGGQLLLPRDGAWLAQFEEELLGFPHARYDDQVDALTQLLIWVRDYHGQDELPNEGPELFTDDDDDGYSYDAEMAAYIDAWGA